MRVLFKIFLIIFLPVTHLQANIYIVKKGDSLWNIATQNKIPLSLIRQVNDLYDDKVTVGQTIFLPSHITNYQIQQNDTLDGIAKRYGIPLSYIITLNNISENQAIEGQLLKIPLSSSNVINTNKNLSQPAAPKQIQKIVYTVSRGDTLGGIAIKHKLGLSKLKEMNKKRNNTVYVGEKLIIGYKDIPVIVELPAKTNIIIHQVEKDQTLTGIALRYGVSVQNIKIWNIKKSDTVYRGENLKILKIEHKSSKPVEKKTNSRSETIMSTTYSVKRGDTLSSIASKFSVSPSQVKAWNKKSDDVIFIGERLKIQTKTMPVGKNISNSLVMYTVKRGDTLDNIALSYKVSRSQLLSWNGKSNTRINIGERLKIYVPVSRQKKNLKSTAIPKKEIMHEIDSIRFQNVPLPVSHSDLESTQPSGRGVDIVLKSQSTLVSPTDAFIEYAGYINALQNVVILKLPEERTVVYAGLGILSVAAGQKVKKGEALGVAGINTLEGVPKIYIEMRDKNKVVNALYAYKELKKYSK